MGTGSVLIWLKHNIHKDINIKEGRVVRDKEGGSQNMEDPIFLA